MTVDCVSLLPFFPQVISVRLSDFGTRSFEERAGELYSCLQPAKLQKSYKSFKVKKMERRIIYQTAHMCQFCVFAIKKASEIRKDKQQQKSD